MSESGESKEPQFPEIDGLIEQVFIDDQEQELAERFRRADLDQQLLDLSKRGEEVGIPIHPGFTEWVHEVDRQPLAEETSLNNYYSKVLKLRSAEFHLSFTENGDHIAWEQPVMDELTKVLIDPNDPDWPKWKKLGEAVIGRELLPGIEPEALPSVLDIIQGRIVQQEVLWVRGQVQVRLIYVLVEDALIDALGIRDSTPSIIQMITFFGYISYDINPKDIDLLEDDELGFIRWAKHETIASLASAYDIDTARAEEVLWNIIGSLHPE